MDIDYLLIANINGLNDKHLFNLAYNRVSEYRKKDVDSYKFESSKCLSLLTELLLIEGFKKLGLDFDVNSIDYSNDKPILHNGYFFNLSHSGEYTICAISKHNIGCDIEKIDEPDLLVAKSFFHEKEYINICAEKDVNKQANLFYKYWTAKEAFVKNLGTGILTPLNSFEIMFGNDISINQNINNESYHFDSLDYIDDYCICLCRKENTELKIENIDVREVLE